MNRTSYRAGRFLPVVALTAALMFLVSGLALGLSTAAGKPAYVSNQLLVQFAPGLTQAQIDAKAQELGMRVLKKVELPNTYLLERLPTRADTPVETIKTRAASDSSIVSAQFNTYYYLLQATGPNDPYWVDGSLWGMKSIRADQGWQIQKGSADVTVAVVDCGVYLAHEDLQGRLLPGRDTAGAKVDDPNDADDDPNPSTDPAQGDGASHGTHVAGTIAAQGNNGKGVIGVCWDNVKIVPVKVFADDSEGATTADIIAGLDFAEKYNSEKGVDVVNMSIGSSMGTPAMEAKLKEMADKGIVLVAAAGNEAGPVDYPAAYPECIAVSAVDKNDQLTPYSNWGPEIALAAPGGYPPDEILSTWWSVARGATYGYMSGTSMACPHVAGAAALVISNGTTRTEVRQRLMDTARTPNIGGFVDPRKYGAGIVDLSKALAPPAGYIQILQPKNAGSLENYTVHFVIRLVRVRRETIKIWIDYEDKNPADGAPDGDPMPTETLKGDDPRISYDSTTGTMSFDYELNPESGGIDNPSPTYNIYVSGLQDLGPEAHAWSIFFVNPKTIGAGMHLFSIPYQLPAGVSPESVIGAGDTDTFILQRWDPTLGNGGAYRTFQYPGGTQGEWEEFISYGGGRPQGATVDTPPLGMGMWLTNSSTAPVSSQGGTSVNTAFEINLYKGSSGWNMVGNPFTYSVNWGAVSFRYQGMTKTMDEAVQANWVRPTLYRYTETGYRFDNAPQGVLQPWEGYWVRALVGDKSPLVMVIPPLQAATTTSGVASRAVVPAGGWLIRLSAATGGTSDSYNYAGVGSGASDGYDRLDAEEPPAPENGISLAFVHKDWGENSGRFAQDVRSSTGNEKTWDFEVSTTLANRDVQVSWPGLATLPKQYSATLEDLDSGSKIFMGTRSSYTYNSGPSGGVRHFRLNVAPENKGRLLVTGVNVTRNRGAGVTIAYSVTRDARVEVRLRNAGNRLIRTLGGNTTRAAGLSSVVWDGILPDGSQAPSGMYICEIVATDADGEVAKVVKPVVLR